MNDIEMIRLARTVANHGRGSEMTKMLHTVTDRFEQVAVELEEANLLVPALLDILEAVVVHDGRKIWKGVHEDEWRDRAFSVLQAHGRI